MRRPAVRATLALGFLLSLSTCGDVSREGTYSGPKDTYVKVVNDTVVEVRLTYAGNVGLTFASASVKWTGSAPIEGDAFSLRPSGAATVSGRFVDGNRKIDGSWQDGDVTGSWSASKD